MPQNQPQLESYVAKLFHELEIKLYASINTYHIELRQELIALATHYIEKRLSQLEFTSMPPSLSFDNAVGFPVAPSPWDSIVMNSHGTFPTAFIRSPIEERKEERKEVVKETNSMPQALDLEALLDSIETIIDNKLNTQQKVDVNGQSDIPSPPAPPSPPSSEVDTSNASLPPVLPTEAISGYAWKDFDPLSYARSLRDMPGF